MTKGVRIEGLEELQEMFGGILPYETMQILQKTANQQADKMRDQLRAAAPKDTGELTNAIVSRALKRKNNMPRAGVIITHGRDQRYDAFHWRFLEYGTVNNPDGKPFIGRTVEQNRASVTIAFRRDMEANLAKKLAAKAKKARKNG